MTASPPYLVSGFGENPGGTSSCSSFITILFFTFSFRLPVIMLRKSYYFEVLRQKGKFSGFEKSLLKAFENYSLILISCHFVG